MGILQLFALGLDIISHTSNINTLGSWKRKCFYSWPSSAREWSETLSQKQNKRSNKTTFALFYLLNLGTVGNGLWKFRAYSFSFSVNLMFFRIIKNHSSRGFLRYHRTIGTSHQHSVFDNLSFTCYTYTFEVSKYHSGRWGSFISGTNTFWGVGS